MLRSKSPATRQNVSPPAITAPGAASVSTLVRLSQVPNTSGALIQKISVIRTRIRTVP